MKRGLSATAMMATLLLSAACVTTTGSTNPDPPRGTNTEAAAPADERSSDGASKKQPKDETLKFGEAFTWEDGLTVTVSQPKPFQPSRYAAAGKGKNHVAFTVRIVNNTGKAFDPSLVYMTMQSGNREADQIFDSAKGLKGAPDTKILDGREGQYKAGFTVKNPNDLVLELRPSFEYDSALWTT